MTDFLHTLVRLLYDFWPVLTSLIVVLVSLILLVRLLQASTYMALGASGGVTIALVQMFSALLIASLTLYTAPALARAITTPLNCGGGFQDLIRVLLYVLNAMVAIRLLWAGVQALTQDMLGAGAALGTFLYEVAAVLMAQAALPFLAALARYVLDISC